jgi:hypothetical protein
MAAAHAARITHRGRKPLNIMVGGDGRVKILQARGTGAAGTALTCRRRVPAGWP